MPMISVSCTLSGDANDGRLDFSGSCGGGFLSSNVRASLRFNPQTGTYSGSFSNGSRNATLSGRRQGDNIALDMHEADEPARQLTLALQNGRLQLSMLRKDDRAQVMQLGLQRS